ncbi:MAG TPA: LPS export ABC transporter periplasmic protein LptC [Halothiobacillus sp.]|nr:LPS export ABC transporter periplasmic protein LptC [Halothiobacillus sp.]
MQWRIPGRFLLFLALTLLAAATGWLNFREQTDITIDPQVSPRVDHSLIGFSTTGFAREGYPAWQLEGKRLNHLGDNQGYEISDPLFRYYELPSDGVSEPPWILEAPAGRADDNLSEIQLMGGVRGHRAATARLGALELQTDEMWLYPEDQLVQTDTKTVIREDGGWTSYSQGFTLDTGQQQLNQPRVRDHFPPTKPQHKTP